MLHLLRHHRHGDGAIHRLPAGHGHRVVVQNLVGDVDLGRHRRADRQVTGMEVSAIAEVLKHVWQGRKRRLADPRRAFTARSSFTPGTNCT